MEYRQLGRSGVRVSALGLGTNNFGRSCDEAASVAVVHRALELGINHIDTSDSYSHGISEQYVGKGIAGHRDDVVIASKTAMAMGDGTNDIGLSYRRMMLACEASLRRLGTDYIDLYYLHRMDPNTPLEETLRACDDLVTQGKVRYIAVSNYYSWKAMEALSIAERRGWAAPIVTQDAYNLLDRSIERELVPFVEAHGLGIVPFSPLAGGLLTGKYHKGEPIQPGVRGYNSPMFARQLTDQNFDLLSRLSSFTRDRDHVIGELAIAWLLAHPFIPSVITGATKPEQLDANVSGAEWRLTPDDISQVEEILTHQPELVRA